MYHKPLWDDSGHLPAIRAPMLRLLTRPTNTAVLACLALSLTASIVVTAGQTSGPPLATADVIANLRMRTIGPATMSGRVVDFAVLESDPTTFYAATATGGLWKTTSNGVTFTPVFEHERVHSIGAVAIAQRNPDVVWVGTGEAANRQSSSWGDGVYKSTDAGRTWQHMGLRDTRHIGRIALHPTNPDIVFVAALGHLWGPNRERGLFKSVDGGAAWKNVLFVDNDTGVVDVAIEPGDPKVMYAAAYQRRRRAWGFHGGGPGSALYKSVDGGDTWTKLVKGLPEGHRGRIGISIYRKDPKIVYACIEQGVRYNASTAYTERRAGVYRSDDRGESWQHMGDWNPRPMYASQIRVDPNDDQRVYMMNAFSYSERRRQDLQGAAPVAARRRPGGMDRPARLSPPHQGRRWRHWTLVRPWPDLAVRRLTSRQPVLPGQRGHAEALLGLWRPAGQRQLGRSERHQRESGRAQRALGPHGRW